MQNINEINTHDEEEVSSSSGSLGGGSKNSGTSAHTTATKFSDSDPHEVAIRMEERAIKRAKLMVGGGILVCAVAVLLSVFFLTKSSDDRSFKLAYEGLIDDIQALTVWEVRYNFALMEQFGAQVTISAQDTKETFPFHTQPSFEMAGGFVDGMGGIMAAGFAPLVKHEQRETWETYSVANQEWLANSAYLYAVSPEHRDALHGTIQDHEHDRRRMTEIEDISPFIYHYDENDQRVRETSTTGQVMAPLWQISPANEGIVNNNLLADPRIEYLYEKMLVSKSSILSSATEIGAMFDYLFDDNEKQFKKDPHAFIVTPIFDKIEETEKQSIVGMGIGVTVYGNLFDRLIPESSDGGIIAVLKDTCEIDSPISYELSSGKAVFLGEGDHHQAALHEFEVIQTNIEMYDEQESAILCGHDLYLYPTDVLVEKYKTSNAGLYGAIFGIAGALVALFIVYDVLVTRRQQKTLQSAKRTRAIVSSLFPERIARKLVTEAENNDSKESKEKKGKTYLGGKNAFEQALSTGKSLDSAHAGSRKSAPLAELFPEATVMFGDLVGFTAWSSQREPSQVFILLETIYAEFDSIAARKSVFKIETIGDCYVAVCGLPNPNKRHAVVMARFAHECLLKTATTLRQLELELGPDTATLGIRIGLHSGPVTAGVLRGERARFQLFGDTVNTTARIESTGHKNRIHISQETARYLQTYGKEDWIQQREDKIVAKGKGELTTYWLTMGASVSVSDVSPIPSGEKAGVLSASAKTTETLDLSKRSTNQKVSESLTRIVSWNVELLKRQLQFLSANRQLRKNDDPNEIKALEDNLSHLGSTPLSEVKDVVYLQKYDCCANALPSESNSAAEISPEALSQLNDFVLTVAMMYHDNSFHNFEHASHVTMSTLKLLSRIVTPRAQEGVTMHDNTYGITSDPLIRFSVLFAAMIHDVDHPGVPNMQLKKEGNELSALYPQSTAEQNSVDIVWALLMENQYSELRKAIYTTKDELKRFRQLVVNCVMATDIMDKDIGKTRKERWNKAFASDLEEVSTEDVNRKATIVIEHLIQASDVAHTMQHWHVFSRWNERLFRECYDAFKAGRAEKDPTDSWYEGEIGFFNFYIIPLAKKLKDCGVFGVSSDECLSYAERNRDEWIRRGKEIVASYVQRIKEEEAKA